MGKARARLRRLSLWPFWLSAAAKSCCAICRCHSLFSGITQFPFVKKVITPYILLPVTTPMLARVPLLIINFGFGHAPRIIAVALATGFRRVDAMKIAAKSYGATTVQIFAKIRVPMAMPMVIVGLMIGAIWGLRRRWSRGRRMAQLS